jgi:hypothetical protein
MPIIGGVGDVIALIGVVKELAAALDGSRGSKAEYQEARRGSKRRCYAIINFCRLDAMIRL